MNKEARRIVEALRFKEDFECIECPIPAGNCEENCLLDVAADLIESLSAQLDQVTRERDAAVKDLKLWYCFSCNNKSTPYCQECTRNRVRLVKGYLSGRNHYEWRGAEVEG